MLLWLWLVVMNVSPVAVSDTRGISNLQSAFGGIDIWGSNEVPKALYGAVGTCIKSQQRPVYSCSHCASDAGGSIDWALSGKK